ncbi:MAG: hypothetical protein KBA66_12625 [Leptospiraceae bacterium]|nr:hypothetical protein [Leptospiraceae bacterium]
MITLKELFELTEFEDVYKCICLYYGNDYSKEDLKSAFYTIQTQSNIENSEKIILSMHFFRTENSNRYTYAVYGYHEEDSEECYCLWYYPWIKLANCPIDEFIISSFSKDPGFMASHFLFDATWMGYSQEQIDSEFQKAQSREVEGKLGTLVGNKFYEIVR